MACLNLQRVKMNSAPSLPPSLPATHPLTSCTGWKCTRNMVLNVLHSNITNHDGEWVVELEWMIASHVWHCSALQLWFAIALDIQLELPLLPLPSVSCPVFIWWQTYPSLYRSFRSDNIGWTCFGLWIVQPPPLLMISWSWGRRNDELSHYLTSPCFKCIRKFLLSGRFNITADAPLSAKGGRI